MPRIRTHTNPFHLYKREKSLDLAATFSGFNGTLDVECGFGLGVFLRAYSEKYPERFAHIDAGQLVAYGCVNKDRPDGKLKPYEMSAEKSPESFTNTKQYFIKLYMKEWEIFSTELKQWYVFSALTRIVPDKPGKLAPLDYSDQAVIVRTIGPDWYKKQKLPNLLSGQPLRFVDEGPEEDLS